MRRIWIERVGGPEVLTIREEENPTPRSGEILISVAAAGVNFADVLARTGMYPDAPPMPCVVGYEVSGYVAGVGPDVGHLRPDLIEGVPVMALTRFGGYADRVAVPIDQVFSLPPELPVEDAAAVPVNYLTAWIALTRLAPLAREDTLLIENAGGGVGIAALHIARLVGARTIGTASAWKHAALLEAGLNHAVDYRHQDVAEAVRREAPDGVDVILNPLGGSTVRRDLSLLAPLGHLVLFGMSEPVRAGRRSLWRLLRSVLAMGKVSPLSLIGENRAIAGFNIGRLWSETSRLRSAGDLLIKHWQNGAFQPRIHARVPFDRASEAHRILQDRENLGKVLLVP